MSINELNVFLQSPLFDHILLTKRLVVFTVFLLLIRNLTNDFARNLVLLLVSLALLDVFTSPFYVFLFTAMAGGIYYLLFWMQWSARKKLYSYALSGFLVLLYFLLMNLPAFRTPWTGQMVHQFGIAYSLIRFLTLILDTGNGRPLPADPLDFFVYAFFLPPFFQGPIERLNEFKENLTGQTVLTWGDTGSHVIRIFVGILKGWVALHFFSLDWKVYFDYPQIFSYELLVWGFYARAISFYLMVSAANDLTIACCALAGYRLHENYDYPYFKRNLAQFWRSWHMTFFRFLKDYIYIPLGGNRRRVYLNYLIVFLAAAMWHVTGMAFLIWGLWHGIGMCLLRVWQQYWLKVSTRPEGFSHSVQLWARNHPRLTATAAMLATFHFVALGWLPFWGGHPQGLSMILRIISGNQWTLFVWNE